jgi:hypothetical protein
MSSTFDIKTLGQVVAKALGLKSGENVEIQRDRLNPDRVMILRVRDAPGAKP